VTALLPGVSVEFADRAARKVHDPGHPMADAQGFVAYPAVDAATEMVTLMSATRAYEANVAAMNAARTMALKALDIGGA
jgi:flagellar basal-body rod protein FlgC